MCHTLIRRDEVLEEKLNELFGEGVIKHAYALLSGCYIKNEFEIDRMFDETEYRHEDFDDDDDGRNIDFDEREFLVEFINGRLIRISSSGWGSLSLMNRAYLKEIKE